VTTSSTEIDMSRVTTSRSVCGIAALLVAFCITPNAFADEVDDAFNEGMQALGQSKYDEACAAFTKAEDLGGATMRTRYQLGRCNQERGKHVDAHRAFADVARLADDSGDTKRASAARERMVESAKAVGLLTITVPDATAALPGLRVERDGELVPPRNFGQPVAVTPGAHQIKITADGKDPLELPVSELLPGQSAQVTLPELMAGDVAAAPPSGATPPATSPKVDAGPGKANPTLFWTGLGFVIAGPLLGAAGGYTLVEEEETEAGIAGMVVGGALLAVGIPFMVIGGRDAEPTPAAAFHVGPSFVGVTGSF
jgi:hypothetical protein